MQPGPSQHPPQTLPLRSGDPSAIAAGLDEPLVHGAIVDEALALHGREPGALLPVLHAIQDRLGYVPAGVVARVADGLNLSRADVHGVVSFYHDFRSAPPGRHVLKLCRAEACQSMGSDALEDQLKARCGVELKQTSSDGNLTLEPVYCLGNCALSPALLLDGKLHGRVTGERLAALLAGLATDVKVGS